ncbi:MAG: hypothetical protein ACRD35_10140 [Candidatus Acidiferrales bacterium]
MTTTPERRRVGSIGWRLLLSAALLAGCGEPLVPRTPEALYALAQEQIANANFRPAVDTLARVAREAPRSEPARRARPLRIALLSGMAHGFASMGEDYLAGHQQASAAAFAPQMRTMAMDYFGRARGRSIELLEALDLMLHQPLTEPLRFDLPRPLAPGSSATVSERVRKGEWVEETERQRAETDAIWQQFSVFPTYSGTTIAGEGPVEIAAGAFYLGVARDILELSKIYRPEALNELRMLRLFTERAATAAQRAAELAREKGDTQLETESQQVLADCQEALTKKM